jgi:hypothetical protein
MNAIISLIRKDLADPMGSAITMGLIASLITLVVIGLISIERGYLDIPDSVRAVGAEDDCAYGVHEVKRIGDKLYCIGEP